MIAVCVMCLKYGWFSENVPQCVTSIGLVALDLHISVANRLVQCTAYTVQEIIFY